MKIAYNKNYWDKYKEKVAVSIDLLKNPSTIINGSSRSGKSYALKWLIKEMLEEYKVDFYFCNYKDSADFQFLKEYGKYYVGEDCEEGFQKFYDRFVEIQEKEKEDIKWFTIMIFDEYVAFILRMQNEDKKKAEKYSRMLSDMLMFFRSYKGGCWIVCQRSDANFFADGRENFHNKIFLTRGRPSRESIQMLGLTRDDFQDVEYRVGEGIAYIDGQGLYQVKYPIYDNDKINNMILKSLECLSSEVP